MRHLGRHMRIGLAAALAACAVALAPAAAASAADVSDLLPAVSPPGANDFTCKPTTAHPAPVVLVHGTFEGAADNWATASPKFKAAGYCVFALEYGNRGTGDIAASAGQLQRFVDAVLGATGARKVSMVGHSQGGMMPRYYLKFLGGATKVDDLVGLAPSNHGTDEPRRPRRRRDLLPRVRSAARRLALPREPQRRRRDPRRRLLHADRDALRRGRHPVHLGLPGPRPPYRQHPAPGRLPGRGDRPPRDAQRRARDPLGTAGARAPGPRGPGSPAQLHLAPSGRWTNPAGWLARGARRAVRPTPDPRLSERAPAQARGRCAAASEGPWAGTSSSRPGASSWPAAARRGRGSRRAGSPPTGRCPSS